MKIREIFQKDIYRNIEGVIKADDTEHIFQEVDEYVITNEVEDKLDEFFRNYDESINTKGYQDIGVWVSGFFGSGKSHLIKILSYLIENRELNGRNVVDIFIEKLEKGSIELPAQIKNATKIPTETILFNIDQKADQTKKDSIVSVMQRVLNEKCGYCSERLYLAELERNLDKLGIYDKFKDYFQEEASGDTWTERRGMVDMMIDEYAKAFSKAKGVSEDDAKEALRSIEDNFTLTIEHFANSVKEYIDSKGENFRLIFLIDEVGQYISGNSQLMLNLQTISETLGSVCKGRVWIIVTAQQDMDAIIGDARRQQENDYSKIQGRFRSKLNLTSKNIDEVIQKRMLAKVPDAYKELRSIYNNEKNTLNQLIYFDDEGRSLPKLRDANQFALDFPFLPYQYKLMQDAIVQLARHNAMLGKHHSVGERSMLEIYQLTAQKLSDKNLRSLAPFDFFYDAIEAVIKTEAKRSLDDAEKNDILDEFDYRVLKVLFLVRYIDTFKASCPNIATLLVDSIDVDKLELEKKVKNALEKLDRQSYIDRLGDVYQYMTDEEKDMQEEIKNQALDDEEVSDYLQKIIFSQIINENKFQYKKTKQTFSVTHKLDEKNYTRLHPLTFHVITPLYEGSIDDLELKTKSMQNDDLLIVSPVDSELYGEIALVLKTEKYLKKRKSVMSEREKVLFHQKGLQTQEKRNNLISRVNDLLGEARFFLNGSQLSDISPSSDPKHRIIMAFQKLVEQVFPKLKMLKKVYKEEDIKTIVASRDNLTMSFGEGEDALSDSIQEVRLFLNNLQKNYQIVTIKKVLDHFRENGFGWYDTAILCQIAELYARGIIMLKYDSHYLDNPADVLKKLKSNREYEKVSIEIQKEFSTSTINEFRSFYKELFNEVLESSGTKGIHESFREKLTEEVKELKKIYAKRDNYSFLKVLSEPISEFNELLTFSRNQFYELLNKERREKILDLKEDVIDPVMNFMNGQQKHIYDQVRTFLTENKSNINCIDDREIVEELRAILNSNTPYRGGVMTKAKGHLESLKKLLIPKIKEARYKVKNTAKEYMIKLKEYEGFEQIPFDAQESVLKPFKDFIENNSSETLIAVINQQIYDLTEIYQKQLTRVMEELEKISQPKEYEYNEPDMYDEESLETETESKPVKPIPKVITVSINQISSDYKKTTIESEDDVKEYIKDLENKLMDNIKNNKKIIL